jgi:putative copper export protein
LLPGRIAATSEVEMLVDRYTKIVLTIIAVSLAISALDTLIMRAVAQSPNVMRVAICSFNNSSNCADVKYGYLKVQQ